MFKIVKNENDIDRFIRIILAELFLIAGLFWFGGVLQIIFYVLSLVALVTGITGFCGLYKILNFSTNKNSEKVISRKVKIIFIVLILIIPFIGIYYSDFFTKKIFLENYAAMNQYYKQALFQTGQAKRPEAIENYDKFIVEYRNFSGKYLNYHPFVISGDGQFNADVLRVGKISSDLKDVIYTGDLTVAHTGLEAIRPIFQDILKRNNFSMLSVYLVDFHDIMEKIITAADNKDSDGIIAVYPEADSALKLVEGVINDSDIQNIRKNLEVILISAKNGDSASLSKEAADLKSSFIKVYLTRG